MIAAVDESESQNHIAMGKDVSVGKKIQGGDEAEKLRQAHHPEF